MSNNRTIITGGAGFIGSHVTDALVAAGHDVLIIDNLRTGNKNNLKDALEKYPDNVTFVEGDIRDAALLEKHFQASDTVIHLAALVSVPESIEDPKLAHDINVNGMHAVFMAAKKAGIKKIISASSAAVYGNPIKTPIEESHRLQSLSPYALHKQIGEEYGALYSELYGIQTIFLRFFNVYGPRQAAAGGYAAVIVAFMNKIAKNEPATISGTGEFVRDFIFVKDLAGAILSATSSNTLGKFEIINIGSGNPTTINDLWRTMCKIKNVDLKAIYGPERPGDIAVSLADISRAKELLKFEAKTTLEDGLRETMAGF